MGFVFVKGGGSTLKLTFRVSRVLFKKVGLYKGVVAGGTLSPMGPLAQDFSLGFLEKGFLCTKGCVFVKGCLIVKRGVISNHFTMRTS
eukprot:964478-Amphidinium_carterae.1